MNSPLPRHRSSISTQTVSKLPKLPFWWAFRSDLRYDQQYRSSVKSFRRLGAQNVASAPCGKNPINSDHQDDEPNCRSNLHDNLHRQFRCVPPRQAKGKFIRCSSRQPCTCQCPTAHLLRYPHGQEASPSTCRSRDTQCFHPLATSSSRTRSCGCGSFCHSHKLPSHMHDESMSHCYLHKFEDCRLSDRPYTHVYEYTDMTDDEPVRPRCDTTCTPDWRQRTTVEDGNHGQVPYHHNIHPRVRNCCTAHQDHGNRKINRYWQDNDVGKVDARTALRSGCPRRLSYDRHHGGKDLYGFKFEDSFGGPFFET